ncbi:MAG: FtsX-like permease family protein, partial [Pseudomonadales bacterium]
MACGVAIFVMALSMVDSLQRTLDTYYDHHRFAEVFAHLKRAPHSLARRIAEIPGVSQMQTRIVEQVSLDVRGMAEPAEGRLISLPAQHVGGLNALYLRRGRFIEPGSGREVVVSESFADAHRLGPGDSVTAVLNGRRQELRIVGVVLSPEYIYQIRPGDLLPDARRFGVFWIAYDELAAAFDMQGAFNDVSLSLMSDASEPQVLRRLDELTEAYGGLGSYVRDDQLSHKFVTNEIKEMRATAVMVPTIFLAVAAFLLNVVISRLINTQREQIAALKGIGYSRREIGWHYMKLILAIILIAVALGTTVGAWMGSMLTELYTQFFQFPVFEYGLDAWIVVMALVVSTASAVAGTLGAVWRAMRLPPAQAMRPESPEVYRPTILERGGLQRFLSPAMRMIVRYLERRPIKSLLTCAGIALATSILVLGNYMEDAIDYVMDFEFQRVQRYDLSVSLVESASSEAMSEIRHLPGVIHCEPFRALSVRVRSAHRARRVGIMGLDSQGELYRVIDMNEDVVPLPRRGLVLSRKLGELLAVGPGDTVTVEVLQETRPVREVPVSGLVEDFSGMSAYMDIRAVNRLMREGDRVTGAFISADPDRMDLLYRELKDLPQVAGVTAKAAALESFRNTIAQSMLVMKTVNVIFAVIIAFGVVYNSARISLSERSRELATLRVIGFTRVEISMIQLGELAVL